MPLEPESRSGYSPVSSCSAIAQLVEQATVNRPVAGSSPARGATSFPLLPLKPATPHEIGGLHWSVIAVGSVTAVRDQNGKIQGVMTTETTSATRAKGDPTLTKSMKVYFPGPTTSVFTGEETGVMNAADAASATVIAKG